MEMALSSYFPNPAFNKNSIISYTVPQFPPPAEWHNMSPHLKGMQLVPKSGSVETERRKVQKQERGVNFYVLPLKVSDEVVQNTYESYYVMLQQLRNQVMPPFSAFKNSNGIFRDKCQDTDRFGDFPDSEIC